MIARVFDRAFILVLENTSCLITTTSHDKFKSLCLRTIVEFKALFHEWLVSLAVNPCRESEVKVTVACLFVIIAIVLLMWNDLRMLLISILLIRVLSDKIRYLMSTRKVNPKLNDYIFGVQGAALKNAQPVRESCIHHQR